MSDTIESAGSDLFLLFDCDAKTLTAATFVQFCGRASALQAPLLVIVSDHDNEGIHFHCLKQLWKRLDPPLNVPEPTSESTAEPKAMPHVPDSPSQASEPEAMDQIMRCNTMPIAIDGNDDPTDPCAAACGTDFAGGDLRIETFLLVESEIISDKWWHYRCVPDALWKAFKDKYQCLLDLSGFHALLPHHRQLLADELDMPIQKPRGTSRSLKLARNPKRDSGSQPSSPASEEADRRPSKMPHGATSRNQQLPGIRRDTFANTCYLGTVLCVLHAETSFRDNLVHLVDNSSLNSPPLLASEVCKIFERRERGEPGNVNAFMLATKKK
ncbi:hypothetical protein HDU88_007293 [Geranomyces variabilis]|nr:hypothetical protein HDU88_007293 [Geranomyces variabilis]